MFLALRVARPYHPHPLSPSSLHQKTACIRFQLAKLQCSKSGNNDNMENAQNHDQKNGDVMSNSFGEGYSSRSEEEGFGGTYGAKEPFPKPVVKNRIHSSHPDFDKTQGSDVKEKEKGRNTTDASK